MSSVDGSEQTCTKIGFTVLWIGTPGFRAPSLCTFQERFIPSALDDFIAFSYREIYSVAVLGHCLVCRSYSPRLAAKKHTC